MPPKRKRDSSQDKIDKYRRKLEELEDKRRRKRRRVIVYSSSESDNDSDLCHPVDLAKNSAQPELEQDASALEPVSEGIVLDLSPTAALLNNEAALTAPTIEESGDNVPSTSNPVDTIPELDPELLIALGEDTLNTPKYGDNIHNTLAQRWEPILKKGLPKEVKDKLLKDYLVPDNCKLLQAPKLNVEVGAAISETARSRDKRKESDQQQLGLGISAINKAMTVLLTTDKKVEAIKLLSDGCRILTDLHYQDTQSRISVINFGLAKPFLNIVQDNERDETLYGTKLSDKIKASKVIEKQGLQIKKYKITKTSSTAEPPMHNMRQPFNPGHPTTSQGNWLAPSRFQQNRGGRRGLRRQPPMIRRPPLQSPQTPMNPTGPSKPRAPARP